MTREEAIEELERLLSHWDDLENGKRSFQWYSKDAVGLYITALRPISREQVEKVWRGEWILELVGEYKHLKEYHCSECGYQLPLNPTKIPIFCENCGSPLTDEAVQMVMEKLEKMKDDGTDN